MFVNTTQVNVWTGETVTNAGIAIAQGVVESYAGRTEDEVSSPDDFAIMAKAVAYQAAYMVNNTEKVFEQVALVQSAQMDGSMTLDRDMVAPFIAPLAVLTLRKASWRRSRSVKTGPIFGRTWYVGWERD